MNLAMVRFSQTGHEDFVKKGEGGIAFFLFFLWAVAIGLINEVISISAGSLYIITNANVYYFTWACFFLVLAIVGNTIQDFGDELRAGSSRNIKWMVLIASSLIVMSSSITIYRAENCRGKNGSFCQAVNLGLALGCCGTALVLMIIGLVAVLGKENPNKFLQIEIIVGVILSILYAVAVAFITGPGGPGSTIGNLYYSTWISFLFSVAVSLDCLGTILQDVKLPAVMTGQASAAASPEQASAPNRDEDDI